MHSSVVQILSNGHAALVTYDSRNLLTDELFKCPNNVTYFSMTNSYLHDDENDDKYDDDDDDYYDGDVIDYDDDDDNDDVINDDDDIIEDDDIVSDDNHLHTNKLNQLDLYLKDKMSSEHLNNTILTFKNPTLNSKILYLYLNRYNTVHLFISNYQNVSRRRNNEPVL